MSGGEASEGERSHEATPQRLQKAQEQGDIARSPDAQLAVGYVGLALAVSLCGAGLVSLAEALMAPLMHPYALAREVFGGGGDGVTLGLMQAALWGSATLLLGPGLLILLFLAAQNGIVFAPDKIAPKLSRISPLSNIQQKYGSHGLVEFVKSAAKLTALGIVLAMVIWSGRETLLRYVHLEARLMMHVLSDQFWALMQGVLVVAIAIGALDFFWQRFSHAGRLRMSHQDLREEHKNIEGDPHVKAERRARAKEIANNRMLMDVPRADVVVTNPTHYAVALQWHRTPGSAPICIAKGVDELARAIRERAEAAGVPMHADPPTARAIHATVEVGAEVHPDHYKAVAAAIVFADALRRTRNAQAGR